MKIIKKYFYLLFLLFIFFPALAEEHVLAEKNALGIIP